MTDMEKMLELIKYVGEEQKENQQNEMNKMGEMVYMMYQGYKRAGFTQKMAFELTKASVVASVQGALKK